MIEHIFQSYRPLLPMGRMEHMAFSKSIKKYLIYIYTPYIYSSSSSSRVEDVMTGGV
jgi:hypothetical protein